MLCPASALCPATLSSALVPPLSSEIIVLDKKATNHTLLPEVLISGLLFVAFSSITIILMVCGSAQSLIALLFCFLVSGFRLCLQMLQ